MNCFARAIPLLRSRGFWPPRPSAPPLFVTTTSGREGLTHLIVDRSDTANRALAGAELAYTEADVLHFELPNAPGALAKFARKVAQKDINITLGYATSEKGSKKTSSHHSIEATAADGAFRYFC